MKVTAGELVGNNSKYLKLNCFSCLELVRRPSGSNWLVIINLMPSVVKAIAKT